MKKKEFVVMKKFDRLDGLVRVNRRVLEVGVGVRIGIHKGRGKNEAR